MFLVYYIMYVFCVTPSQEGEEGGRVGDGIDFCFSPIPVCLMRDEWEREGAGGSRREGKDDGVKQQKINRRE